MITISQAILSHDSSVLALHNETKDAWRLDHHPIPKLDGSGIHPKQLLNLRRP
jgi:hypothetical protein